MAENITTQSAEIDLLLGWRKKMSDFNFEFDDRILEYLAPVWVGPVCFKRGKNDWRWKTGDYCILTVNIYACVSGP